jgi:alpha-1,6-mannosyltransferase
VVNNAPLSWALALLGWEAGQVLRPLLAIAAGIVALAAARPPPGAPDALVRSALVVAAAVFYLSPAQYPWYAVWFLPFAAILGCRALLLPAVLLPLYYLFFALLEAPWQRAFFAQGIAAVHLLGVLAMLIQSRRRWAIRP